MVMRISEMKKVLETDDGESYKMHEGNNATEVHFQKNI